MLVVRTKHRIIPLFLLVARSFSSPPSAYADRLRRCSSLEECQSLHGEIIASGLTALPIPGHHLVEAYAKHGSIEQASLVFVNLRERSSLSWRIVFSAFAQAGHSRQVLQLFYRLEPRPDLLTFTMAFGACSRVGTLPEAKNLHARFVSSGLRPDLHAHNALLYMLAARGGLDDARRVFDEMEHRNIISWNTIFAAYGSGNSGEVMQLLREFDLNGFVAEAVTYLSIVKGCDSLKRGKEIHARAVAAGYKSVVLETALLHMYARCGSLRDAREVFDAMQTKDLVSFNAMMSACAQDESLNAVTLFHKLDLEGFSPSAVTYVAVLTACTAAENLSLGRTLHGRLVSGGVRRNYILDNALLNMYAKCGCFDDAKKVFDAMKERDTTSWNAMIAACALHGRGRDAIELFYVMDAEPTAVTFTNAVNACSDIAEARKLHSRIQSYGMKLEAVTENSLIKMYAKCGNLADAENIFELSSRKNGSSWNCLMAAYIDHSKCLKALKLVRRMDFEGMKLDSVTFVHLITACAAAGSNAGTDVSRIHARVLGCFRQPEAVVGNALINMYARTGNLDRASRVFEEMPLKNDASWNAIMTAHAQHGEALRALELYHGMELHGEVPCEITLTVVLLACNHAGLQDDTWYHFAFTSRDYGLELGRVHYHCMLDLLGRQGLLEEARHLLSEMPCDAGAAGWRGVLGACRIHGDDSLGAVAAQSVASIEPEDAASYMLLSTFP